MTVSAPLPRQQAPATALLGGGCWYHDEGGAFCCNKRASSPVQVIMTLSYVIVVGLLITAYVQVTQFSVSTIGPEDPRSASATWSGPDAVTYRFHARCDTPEHSDIVLRKFFTPTLKVERRGVNQTKVYDVVPVTTFDAGCSYMDMQHFQGFWISQGSFPGSRDWAAYAIAAVVIGGVGFLALFLLWPVPVTLILAWQMLLVTISGVAYVMYASEVRPVTQCWPTMLDSFDPWAVHSVQDSRGAWIARNSIWLILDGVFALLKTPADLAWMQSVVLEEWHCAGVELDMHSTWTSDPIARIMILGSEPVRTQLSDFIKVNLGRYWNSAVACTCLSALVVVLVCALNKRRGPLEVRAACDGYAPQGQPQGAELSQFVSGLADSALVDIPTMTSLDQALLPLRHPTHHQYETHYPPRYPLLPGGGSSDNESDGGSSDNESDSDCSNGGASGLRALRTYQPISSITQEYERYEPCAASS
jgi:hypothetical protein